MIVGLITAGVAASVVAASGVAGYRLTGADDVEAPVAAGSTLLAGGGAEEGSVVDDALLTPRRSVLRNDLAAAVVEAVMRAGGLPLATGTCSPEDLALQWTDPGDGWETGAFIEPLGPAPTSS